MGGKLSPPLANIFCHMFEQKIIESEIYNGNILAYYRYVDDILVILKKGQKSQLLQKLNNFDKNLSFTTENMIDNKLNFLDTTLIIRNDQLLLEHYRKPTATDCLINFKTGVSPKNYKIGAFMGELYRCHHSSTTTEARDRAMEISKQIYSKINFPVVCLNKKLKKFEIEIFDLQIEKKSSKKIWKIPISNITRLRYLTLVLDALQ